MILRNLIHTMVKYDKETSLMAKAHFDNKKAISNQDSSNAFLQTTSQSLLIP